MNSRRIFQGFRDCLFFWGSKKTCRERTSNPKCSRIGPFSCQCSIVFRTLRMSKITRWNSRKDFRTLLGPGSEEKWYGKSCDNLKGGLWFYRQHKGTAIQRFWSSFVQKNQCLESWDPLKETLKKPYISMEIPQTGLLFRTILSMNQLSVYGAVANWCQQFGLTVGGKGTI